MRYKENSDKEYQEEHYLKLKDTRKKGKYRINTSRI